MAHTPFALWKSFGARALRSAYSIDDLRSMARKRLPRAIFDFYDGGAEDERTLRANRAAFSRYAIAPYFLRDVSEVSLSTQILGQPAALPLVTAPTGAAGLGWHQADIAVARAALRTGIPYSLSTAATTSIQDVAAAVPQARKWFLAYILRGRAHTEKLIARAETAGYEALMVTVDLPVGGKRERDHRNDFALPFRFTPKNVFDFALHPCWSLPMLFRGMPRTPNLNGMQLPSDASRPASSSVGRNYDPSFTWDDLRRMRDLWPRKLIIKGIMRASDAERAAALGCDAIIVSNHGGRQLDGGFASLDALAPIAAAVGRDMEILFDGSIRRGTDIVMALALGAKAVLVGRAVLYGVSAGGEAGAMQALGILREELHRTMQLCGLSSLDQITPDLLRLD